MVFLWFSYEKTHSWGTHWILTSSPSPKPKNMWRQGATARLREDGLRGVGGHFLREWEHGMNIWYRWL